jgi:hypothetical protein
MRSDLNKESDMSATPLSEIDIYVLFKEHDEVFLFDKDANEEVWRVSFYGEATIGFLGLVNEWAMVGGDRILIWKNHNEFKFIEDPDLIWIHDIRQVEDDEVEVLTDPLGENSAIWRFNIQTEEKVKIRDFADYQGREYTDSIEW